MEKRLLADLQDHPQQADLVGDLSETELAELAENMRQHGLHHRIDILPNGTILAGHQRVRAARRLGWTEIDVVVRHDLESAGDVAIKQFLVEDNLHRRQMDPLTIARTYRTLKEIEKQCPHNELRWDDRRDIRDRLAKKLGGNISGRTLDRYEKILNTPRAVQDAVSRGQLPLQKALAITKLSAQQQQTIAESIRQGIPPKEALNALGGSAGSKHRVHLSSQHKQFLQHLKTWTEAAHPETFSGAASLGMGTVRVLDRAIQLLVALRDAEQRYLEELQAEEDEFDACLERDDCDND
ncbi:MAG: ParB/RepB/Spo0J family partition protein [Gemmataceae bacterium]